jgi:transcriptional regulator with PAS, ATPase and Fis domain
MGKTSSLLPPISKFDDIVYWEKAMDEVITQATALAKNDLPVLIEGETGTGKEILAMAMHEASSRNKGKFVAINCGAIPDNLFESEFFGHKRGAFTGAANDYDGKIKEADKGTLFLDEIGELPLRMQVKLLRVIQDKAVVSLGSAKSTKVDFHVIAATNRDLMSDVAEGKFRQDLFYRLAIGYIRIPPIRERKIDIDLLIDHSLFSINEGMLKTDPQYKRKRLSIEAIDLLTNYDWPGNFRELHFTMIRAALVYSKGSVIKLKDVESALLRIPPLKDKNILNRAIGPGFNIEDVLNEVRRHYLQRAWDQSGKHKTEAAKLVGLHNHQTFVNMCEGVGINIPVKKKKTI